MSKVKLMIVEGYGSQGRPRRGGTEKIVDLNLAIPDTHDIMGVIRYDFDPDLDGSKRANDATDPVIRYERINDLVGKLLTLVDASMSDGTQRKAFKDLLKQIPWDWYMGQCDEMTEAWRADRFPKYKERYDKPDYKQSEEPYQPISFTSPKALEDFFKDANKKAVGL